MAETYTFAIIASWLLFTIVKIITRIRLEVWLGTIIYGLVLVVIRITNGISSVIYGIFTKAKQGRVFAAPEPPISNRDTVRFRLPGLNIILGTDMYGNLIKVDLDRYHTLITGSTGSGKTRAIIAILIQLFIKPEFRGKWRVVLIDLKADWKNDWLNLWAPACFKYFSTSDIEAAVGFLEDLKSTVFNVDDGYNYLVIIDEVARMSDTSGPLKKRGDGALEGISSILRTRGALVCSTQRPYYKIMSRAITANLARKIAFRMDDAEGAEKLTLRRHAKGNDIPNFVDGEFLMIEPGLRNAKRGRTMDTPLEEVQDVLLQIQSDETDWRINLFIQAASGLKAGDQIPGVNRMTKLVPGISQRQVEFAYRNYTMAGATEPRLSKGKNPKPVGTLLVVDYDNALARLRMYINDNKWQTEPDKQVEIVS